MTYPLLSTPPESIASALPRFGSVDDVVRSFAGENPVHCIWTDRAAAMAQRFLDGFRGTVAYAVKCNPHPVVLAALRDAGISHFDVASRAEVDIVSRTAPKARQWFMHPVKSRSAIDHAWKRGVRDFAFDTLDELNKISDVVGDGKAQGLGLHLRLGLPSSEAVWDLSGKFGASPMEAVELLKLARWRGEHLGMAFHVGSQCMSPAVYGRAIALCGEIVDAAGVTLDSLDVGGGFPASYPDMDPPEVEEFFETIHRAADECGFSETPLVCEPGRAMVAQAGSMLVRVELRRGDRLYINDGTYGSLFDAGGPRWRYPARLVRPDEPASATLANFRFLGPTCDSLDVMEGPFLLPDDVREGDWLELRQLGAYGAALRTSFNGFSDIDTVAIAAHGV